MDEIEYLKKLEEQFGTNYIAQSEGYEPHDKTFGLTDAEFLTIRMMVSNGSSLIQDYLYKGRQPTELESLLSSYLDSALLKLPLENTVDEVYRLDSKTFISQSDVSSVITYPAYLTASTKFLEAKFRVQYIIKLSQNTKARCVYRVYEILPEFPECQVEFPRGSRFSVDSYNCEDGKIIIEMSEVN